MKASELILKLQSLVARHGDLEVMIMDSEWSYVSVDNAICIKPSGYKQHIIKLDY